MANLDRTEGPFHISKRRITLEGRDFYLIMGQELGEDLLIPVEQVLFAQKVVIALNACEPYDYEGLRRNHLQYVIDWTRIIARLMKSVRAGTAPIGPWEGLGLGVEGSLAQLGIEVPAYTVEEGNYIDDGYYKYLG